MNSFTFYSPTKVVFGEGSVAKTASEIREFGGSRVLVLYGGGSVKKSGLLGEIEAQLKSAALAYRLLGGVHPNPLVSFARAGVAQAVEFGADFILAVGGGSVIDTAKAIALGAAAPETDIWEFWQREKEPAAAISIGVVLTIPAAGSETSESSVLTHDETREKRGLNSALYRPRFAVMQPSLCATLPKYQIGCGVADIMMHTLERYFTAQLGNELTDQLAEAVLRVAIEFGRRFYADPNDSAAAGELMWAGSLSHNGLTGLGGEMDFSTHQLGHELSGLFDVAHGAALTALWGSYARYVKDANPARIARLGHALFGLNPADAPRAAEQTIDEVERVFRAVDMPLCFSELGIGAQPSEVIERLALGCSRNKTRSIGSFKRLDHADMVAIYNAANH